MLREKPALVAAIMDAVTLKQQSFYQLQGLREQDMEALYAAAYHCYAHEQYEDAVAFFQTFAFYSCFDSRAWIGLAASLKQLHCHDEALLCHYITVRLDSEHAAPIFYTHDCYVVLYKISQSLKRLEKVLPSSNHASSDQPTEHQQKIFCYQEKKQQQNNW